jgi:hypothetical protein
MGSTQEGMAMNGRKTGSGITVGGIFEAVSELRHRLRHRLVLLAAYGPGYGRPDPDDVSMAPWTEDPAIPLGSAKQTPATSAPKSRNSSGHAA